MSASWQQSYANNKKCQGITYFPSVTGEIGIWKTKCAFGSILELYVVFINYFYK